MDGSRAHPLRRLLKLAAPYTGWMALAALLGFATIGSSIALMATAAWIIASAALHPSVAALQVAIVGVRFFGLSRGVFRYLERTVSHQTTFCLLARLRVWLYTQIEPLAPARLMPLHSGDLLSRVVADVDTLQNFYLRVIAPPAVALLVTAAVGIFFAAYDLRLAGALVGVLALAGIGVPLLTLRLGRSAGRPPAETRAALQVALLDGIQGMPDLLACGQPAHHAARGRTLSHDLRREQARMARVGGLSGALHSLLASLALLAVLGIGIPLVRAGRISGVDLAVLSLAALASFEAVQPLPQAFQHLGSHLAAARRLFELVDAPPAVIDPPAPLPLPDSAAPGEDDPPLLAVSDLCFHYAPGDPPALDGLRFTLRRGQTLAVIGESGAGKSTLVNLLLRVWDYQEGSIRLAGIELREAAQEDARARFAVVRQHTHLFNATIRENLRLARPDADDDALIAAAQQAQLDAFIRALPQGYDTWIGEQGLGLSGGERQRLAIARAILKDAPILVLDEATANLDPVIERGVMQALAAAMAGRAVLIITHRLAGLERADEILVLRAGRVVERGRHADLLQIDGAYRRLWALQNQLLAAD